MNDRELRKLYRARTERTPSARARCLTADALVGMSRASQDELSAPERERIADHLVSCSSCSTELRMIRALEDWSRRRAEELSFEDAEDELPPARRHRARAESRRWAIGVAASLALAALGLGVWSASLYEARNRLRAELAAGSGAEAELADTRAELADAHEAAAEAEAARAALERRVAELSSPHLNVPLFDLDPDAALARGSSTAPRTLAVERTLPFVNLILHTRRPVGEGTFGVEITTSDGRPVFAGGGMTPSAFGTFTLALPSTSLPAGDYRIELVPCGSEQRRPIELYSFRVHDR